MVRGVFTPGYCLRVKMLLVECFSVGMLVGKIGLLKLNFSFFELFVGNLS